MSGFKSAILNKSPVLFLTFDGDTFDPVKRILTTSPTQILDESGRGNNAILHDDANPSYFGYRMGMPSLVDLEPQDQYSTSFGYYGAQPQHPSIWAKTYLEVPHSDSFQFPNYGSFSVSMMINKASPEDNFRNYNGNINPNFLVRPILHKGLMFRLDYNDPYGGGDYISVVYPSGTLTWQVYTDNSFYSQDTHLAFSWDVQQPIQGTYTATAKLWINGILVASRAHTYLDTFPVTNVSSPWEVAGTAEASSPDFMNDRQTSSLQIDQLAVFQTALSDDDTLFLFKKTRSYKNMVIYHRPSYYWELDDLESQTDNTIYNTVGNLNGSYIGGTAKILRDQDGPANIPGSNSTRFQDGGCATMLQPNGFATPFFNPDGDYAIEFWFTAENGVQSVLMSMQSDIYPYKGMLVQINTRNNQYSNGGVQFSVSTDWSISSRALKDDNTTPFQFNDGYFHHCVIVRRGSNIELWLDGVLHATQNAPIFTIDRLGQLYLMGMLPGKLNTPGKMCELAFYNWAPAPAIIRCHYSYALVYRIRGQVTLQGVPYQAQVRVYTHSNGQLVKTIQSNASDGNYIIELYDNSLIDLMVLNTKDKNVRYRAYGPITPAEHEDSPV